jgi:hypothetical protein
MSVAGSMSVVLYAIKEVAAEGAAGGAVAAAGC